MSDSMHDQSRWDLYGVRLQEEIAANPAKYISVEWPKSDSAALATLLTTYNLGGKRIMDVGCGTGGAAVWLARQGADVVESDIGPNLIAAAQEVARLNAVEVEPNVSDIRNLSFGSGSFDFVVGDSVLHHLPRADLGPAIREIRRILRPGGRAFFFEPIEDSALFDFVQNIVPRSRPGRPGYRPSILQRNAWRDHLGRKDDRAMSSEELMDFAVLFEEARLFPVGLTVRLSTFLGSREEEYKKWLFAFDDWLMSWCPPTRRLARDVIVEYLA